MKPFVNFSDFTLPRHLLTAKGECAVYRFLKLFIDDRKGATAIEYGLIVALIVLAMMAALGNVAKKTNAMWGNVANVVSNS
jgi:pilus assembly protein Flp/PilA